MIWPDPINAARRLARAGLICSVYSQQLCKSGWSKPPDPSRARLRRSPGR